MDTFMIITAAMLTALLCGVPIAYCLGFAGIAGLLVEIGSEATLAMASQLVFESGFTYEFSVVPLFIAMGNLISRGEISDKLFKTAGAFVGHYRGGLGMAAALTCGAFSAVSGSSLATAATISKASIPQMRKAGYHDSLSTGVIAAGGTLGILIPPSLVLIIYAILAEQDIADMFIAGIVPGLLGVAGYVAAVYLVALFRPELGPRAARTPFRQRLTLLKGVADIFVLFAVVLGGIYFGILASTEAAGVGFVTSIVLVWLRGKLSLKVLLEVLVQTSKTTAVLYTIFVGAIIFTEYVNYSGLTFELEDLLAGLELSGFEIVLAILALCLGLGMVMESMSIILLIVPMVAPILVAYEVDLVWFGILLVVTTEISLITPPVGMNVFVMRSVNPDISIGQIFKGVTPFIFADVFRLGALLLFPALVL